MTAFDYLGRNELIEEIERLTEDVNRLNVKNGHKGNEIGRLKKEIDALKITNTALNIENVNLKKQTTELQKENSEFKAAVTVLQKQGNPSVDDIKKLIDAVKRTALEEITKLRNEHGRKIALLEKKTEDLESRLDESSEDDEEDDECYGRRY